MDNKAKSLFCFRNYTISISLIMLGAFLEEFSPISRIKGNLYYRKKVAQFGTGDVLSVNNKLKKNIIKKNMIALKNRALISKCF